MSDKGERPAACACRVPARGVAASPRRRPASRRRGYRIDNDGDLSGGTDRLARGPDGIGPTHARCVRRLDWVELRTGHHRVPGSGDRHTLSALRPDPASARHARESDLDGRERAGGLLRRRSRGRTSGRDMDSPATSRFARRARWLAGAPTATACWATAPENRRGSLTYSGRGGKIRGKIQSSVRSRRRPAPRANGRASESIVAE